MRAASCWRCRLGSAGGSEATKGEKLHVINFHIPLWISKYYNFHIKLEKQSRNCWNYPEHLSLALFSWCSVVTLIQGSGKRGFWRVTFCLPWEKVIQEMKELPMAGLPRQQQPSLPPLLKIKAITHSLCPRCRSRDPPRAVQHLLSSCWSFPSFAGLKSNLDAALSPSGDKHPMNCLLVWSPRMLQIQIKEKYPSPKVEELGSPILGSGRSSDPSPRIQCDGSGL